LIKLDNKTFLYWLLKIIKNNLKEIDKELKENFIFKSWKWETYHFQDKEKWNIVFTIKSYEDKEKSNKLFPKKYIVYKELIKIFSNNNKKDIFDAYCYLIIELLSNWYWYKFKSLQDYNFLYKNNGYINWDEILLHFLGSKFDI